MGRFFLNTGQRHCYDPSGRIIDCRGTGQDAECRPGEPWPESRFEAQGEVVRDRLTGLVWSRDANGPRFPLTWPEALAYVQDLNLHRHLGRDDWRLPNRRELRSLISYQTRIPALPQGHPFENVFRGWYWTSTSWAKDGNFAWYVHLEGGRMFFGQKNHSYLVWPVWGPGSDVLPQTGQTTCFDDAGRPMDCTDTGQDGEQRSGVAWPEPRFEPTGEAVRDRLTELVWTRMADLSAGPIDWAGALARVQELNERIHAGRTDWRLPTINELESLVDASRHAPALPAGHPFVDTGEAYWSATTSSFEPDWAMALYLDKGAVGVGQKGGAHFRVWAVSG